MEAGFDAVSDAGILGDKPGLLYSTDVGLDAYSGTFGAFWVESYSNMYLESMPKMPKPPLKHQPYTLHA